MNILREDMNRLNKGWGPLEIPPTVYLTIIVKDESYGYR